jgi:hypothetical protein
MGVSEQHFCRRGFHLREEIWLLSKENELILVGRRDKWKSQITGARLTNRLTRRPSGGEMKRFVFTLALAALLTGSAFAGELLVNGGFESGVLSPWFNARDFCGVNCVPWNVNTMNPHSGMFSAMDVGNIELRQNFTPTPASMITSVTFWVNSTAGADAVDFFYTDNSDEEFVVFSTPGVWNFEDVTADLDPGKTLSGFSIFGADPGFTTFFDDASIMANVATTPEPGTLVMLGSGALGLLGAIRRRARL